jgi:hypothetical protein
MLKISGVIIKTNYNYLTSLKFHATIVNLSFGVSRASWLNVVKLVMSCLESVRGGGIGFSEELFLEGVDFSVCSYKDVINRN